MGACIKKDKNSVEPRHARAIAQSEILPYIRTDNIRACYEFRKVLGHGHFGTVRLAVQILKAGQQGQKVAIKTISKANIKEDLDALRRELVILTETDHPNIINLHEVFEDALHIHIVMEHCKGGDLFDYIIHQKHLSEHFAASIMQKLLLAVNYLHNKMIVHRDLKPDNVLFVTKEANAEIKLIDFGLSNKFGRGNLHSVVGTPYYVAPEVLHKHYGKECDIWSLGALLYVLLAGYPPFDGQNHESLYRKISRGTFKFDHYRWKNISKQAKDLISKMLVVNIRQRITIPNALKHQWFTINKTTPEVEIPLDIFQNLKGLKAQQKLKKEAMKVVIKHLEIPAIQELREIFFHIDKSNNGFITGQELRDAMVQSGYNIATEEIEKILNAFQYVQGGKLYYSDFIMNAVDKKRVLNEENLYAAFKHFDVGNKGYIDKANINVVLESAGSPLGENEAQNLLKRYKNKITFDDFKEILGADDDAVSPIKTRNQIQWVSLQQVYLILNHPWAQMSENILPFPHMPYIQGDAALLQPSYQMQLESLKRNGLRIKVKRYAVLRIQAFHPFRKWILQNFQLVSGQSKKEMANGSLYLRLKLEHHINSRFLLVQQNSRNLSRCTKLQSK